MITLDEPTFDFHATHGSLSQDFCRTGLSLSDNSVKQFLTQSPYGFIVLDAELTPGVVASAERLLSFHKEQDKMPKPHFSTLTLILEKKGDELITVCGSSVLERLPQILKDDGQLTNHFYNKMVQFAGMKADNGFIVGGFALTHSDKFHSLGPSWEIHIDDYGGDVLESERLTLPYLNGGTVYLLLDHQQRLDLNGKLQKIGQSLINAIDTFSDICHFLQVNEIPYVQLPENSMGLHLRGLDAARQLIGGAHGTPNFLGSRLFGSMNREGEVNAVALINPSEKENNLILERLETIAGGALR